MGKKVIIISSSPRKDGNSDTLAESFASGAEKGALAVGGVSEKGEIKGRSELQTAYDMGFQC